VKGTETIYGLHAVRVMLERQPERVVALRLAERRDDPRVRQIDELARRHNRPIQRVDAHALGARPIFSTDVIAGAVCIEDACGQMTDGVASNNASLFARDPPNACIKIVDDFGVGFGPIVEVPSCDGGRAAHLVAPLSE